MKKLSKLTLRNVNASDVMSDQEMKNVLGGGAPGTSGIRGTCGVFLPGGKTDFYGRFTADSYTHTPASDVIRGISYADAMNFIAGQSGARWCCDNCSNASWY